MLDRLKRAAFGEERNISDFIGAHGCLNAAASFITWNQVPGDYIEFGVWKGRSFAAAYHAMTQGRRKHQSHGYTDPEYVEWAQKEPRFIAFDSFEGIPGGEDADRMVDYHEGAYDCGLEQFLENIRAQGVDLSRVETVKGFYDATCTAATREKLQLTELALVHIDCDLYESTVPVLDFVTDALVQGSVIVFDDWFRFRGSPNKGEQRACNEWLQRNPQLELIEHWQQGPQSKSFIVNFDKSSPG